MVVTGQHRSFKPCVRAMLESDQGLLYCISTIVSVPIMVVSPGSGKASLILRTVEGLKGSLRLGVIEADIDSTVDAEKVAYKTGAGIEGWIDWLKGEVAAFKGLR